MGNSIHAYTNVQHCFGSDEYTMFTQRRLQHFLFVFYLLHFFINKIISIVLALLLVALCSAVEVLYAGALVEPFGSFVSNLYTRWGDLDISVDVPNGSLVPSVGKRRKQTLLRDIMRALRRNGNFFILLWFH